MPSLFLQTALTHLNLDSRHITDTCLCQLLPLGSHLRELDMYGAKVTSKGVQLLAGAYTGLEKLDLCGGHVTGETHHYCQTRSMTSMYLLGHSLQLCELLSLLQLCCEHICVPSVHIVSCPPHHLLRWC